MLRIVKCLSAVVLALIISPAALGQMRTFTMEGVEFTLALPSSTWRWVVSPIETYKHVEFINGNDVLNGHLRIVRRRVDQGTTPADLFQRDQVEKLQLLPGYVLNPPLTGEVFQGHLRGRVFSYEYTNGGSLMAGRIYYQQADDRIVYTLHFRGLREKLQSIRDQMDQIARSFRLRDLSKAPAFPALATVCRCPSNKHPTWHVKRESYNVERSISAHPLSCS
jgi:hypothetical protein